MQIIIDADACPKMIKEILYRAAQKNNISTTLVANTHIRTPQSTLFKSIIVPVTFNEADDKITEIVAVGDLVVTADIPLADRIVKKGATALDPRGEFYTEENIGSRLAVRDLLHELREGGLQTGGPPSPGARERQAFAQCLQYFITHRRAP
jgi:uncharacterized protein